MEFTEWPASLLSQAMTSPAVGSAAQESTWEWIAKRRCRQDLVVQ